MTREAIVGISDASVLSPLGKSLDDLRSRLSSDERGLSRQHRFSAFCPAPLGEIPWAQIGLEAPETRTSDELLAKGADWVLRAVMARLAGKARDKIGLFVGTTTCGVSGFYAMNRERKASGKSVQSLLNPDMQQAFVAHHLAEDFAIEGPVYTFSTSCVASSQAFVMAHDAVQMGWVETAVVLGIDVLNPTTLYGFEALQLLDEDFCQPFTAERKGINLSEAIVALVLEKSPSNPLALVKSHAALAEAHHMTQPAPGGIWMKACMEKALRAAGLKAEDIAYLNPHATGTLMNDEAEMEAIRSLFGTQGRRDPSKRLSGHALGASGALEILWTALALGHHQLRYGMKNSFGFGGANLSLILERGER